MAHTVEPADDMAAQQRMGDAVMTVAMVLYALGAVVLGWVHDQPGLPWTATLLWTAGLVAPGLIGLLAMRGTLGSRLLLAFSLTSLVALHIQVSAGMIEFHFGVFVTLALLMVYLDWRVIVFSAALFAVHHIGFDRLHAMGFGVYCLPEPNFAIVVLHAVYVVVQTGLQVFLVVRLARFVRDNSEVALLASSIQDGDRIALDLSAVRVQAPLATQLKHNLGRMASAVATVRSAADNLQTASTEIAGGNLDLSQRTEQTANRLQETSGSLGHLNAGAKQSVDAAMQARQLAESATTTAVRGGEVVGQVVHTMSAINQSSEKIRDIIGVIDGIAFQTNILALNAAVEAARAGEAGRGFAVVAAEVRQLAQRSAQAAREIKELINTSVDRVQSGSQQVQLAGQTMEELVASVKRVTDIIAEISASSNEQSQGIHHVNEAVAEVDQMTQQNAALVEQSTAATESLKEQVLRLIDAMTVFRLEGVQSASRSGSRQALEWRN